MDKLKFKELFDASALEMLAAFRRGSAGSRADEIGFPREEQVRVFLENWLPGEYGIGKGYIANQNRDISKECDIILFDNLRTPRFVINRTNNLRIIPISYVYATMEVKSSITNREMENIIEKARSIIDNFIGYVKDKPQGNSWTDYYLKLSASDPDNLTKKIPDNQYDLYRAKIGQTIEAHSQPLIIVFAYQSDLSLKSIYDRFKEQYITPDIVCVLDKGLLIKSRKISLVRNYAQNLRSTSENINQSLRMALHGLNFETISEDCFIIQSDKSETNLMNFYVQTFELLRQQTIQEYFQPSDLISIWNGL